MDDRPECKFNTERLRVGIIGCGAVVQQLHLPVLAGHEHAELVCLVDVDIGRAKALAKDYQIPSCRRTVDGLTSASIDAAIVATPPAYHVGPTLTLLRNGIPVLVEKPLATCFADAGEMVSTARERNLPLGVGFFRRLFPSVKLARQLIVERTFGRPVSCSVSAGGIYDWKAATLGNMRRELAGGGVLLDFGSHLLDLLHAIVDGTFEALSYSDDSQGGIEAHCKGAFHIIHDDIPVTTTFEFSRIRELPSRIRIECERGAIQFLLSERFRVRLYPQWGSSRAGSSDTHAVWMESCDASSPDQPWWQTFRAEIDDFIAAVLHRRQPRLSGESALPVVKLIDELYDRRERLPYTWHSGSHFGTRHNDTPASTADSCPGIALGDTSQTTRTLLLTGATGFVGTRLAEALVESGQWRVRALVNTPANASRLARLPVELVQGDLTSRTDTRRLVRGCMAVVHCATAPVVAEHRKSSRHFNIVGTRVLATSALDENVSHFVYFSSIAVYGDPDTRTGVLRESDPLPRTSTSEYARQKQQCEVILKVLQRRGLPCCILRPARIFGPWGKTFVTLPLQSIISGRFSWRGNPDRPCDMVYVDNVVAAVLAALATDLRTADHFIYNVSDADSMTWRQFYAYFAERLGISLDSVPLAAPDRIAHRSPLSRAAMAPVGLCRNIGEVFTSPEMLQLLKRILRTSPLGSLPRAVLARSTAIEHLVRRVMRIDGRCLIYELPAAPVSGPLVSMGSAGAVSSIERLQEHLGYTPFVTREEAMEQTWNWIAQSGLLKTRPASQS